MARKKASPAPTWASDPQYQAFEADLTAHPDDDTPRLVLADWLEEHGDDDARARAEFIRVQVELARTSKDEPRHDELTRRQEVLLGAHQEHWLGALAKVVTGAVWQRGFPQRMKLGLRAFMDNADEIFRQAPILHLQLLRINQTKMTMEELAACPHFARLRGFSLPGSSVGDEKLSTLLRKADFRNIEHLELKHTDAREETLAAIASGRMPRLRSLDLSENPLEFAVQKLFRDDVPFALTELNLGGAGLNAQDIEALFRWRGLAAVERLELWNVRLGNAGARHLADCPHLGRLRRLRISGCDIGMRGMVAVAESETLAGLREVWLGYNSILHRGLEALLASPFAGNLRELHLTANNLADAGLRHLAAWPGLHRIRALELHNNNVGPEGVEALCSSPHLGSLTSLDLGNNPIGDEGAKSLAGCPRLASLRRMDLSLCGLGTPGVEALLASPYLTRLTQASLDYNNVDRGVMRRVRERFRPVPSVEFGQ